MDGQHQNLDRTGYGGAAEIDGEQTEMEECCAECVQSSDRGWIRTEQNSFEWTRYSIDQTFSSSHQLFSAMSHPVLWLRSLVSDCSQMVHDGLSVLCYALQPWNLVTSLYRWPINLDQLEQVVTWPIAQFSCGFSASVLPAVEDYSGGRAVKSCQKTHPCNRTRQHRLTVYT